MGLLFCDFDVLIIVHAYLMRSDYFDLMNYFYVKKYRTVFKTWMVSSRRLTFRFVMRLVVPQSPYFSFKDLHNLKLDYFNLFGVVWLVGQSPFWLTSDPNLCLNQIR